MQKLRASRASERQKFRKSHQARKSFVSLKKLLSILVPNPTFNVHNSAMNGKIHTSVFTSERLLMELREIKMNIPVGIMCQVRNIYTL